MGKEQIVELAAAISTGVYSGMDQLITKVMWIVVAAIVIHFVLGIVFNYFTANYDDTDNYSTKERSGMKLYTDHGTGFQYLGTSDGGMTPRIDKNGNHMNIYIEGNQ